MNVLIVDDLKDIRDYVALILKKEGYQCDLSENGTTALKMADENAYDLILLDIQLPDLDGYAVCKQLKQLPALADVPILFLTSLEKTEQVVRGLNAGAVDYIKKPFDKKELLARIKVHLDLRKTRLKLKQQISDNRQLVHILCHDLKNPIASTVTLLELMTEDLKGSEALIPLVRQYLDRGLELIDMIRDLSAIEDNKVDIKLESVNLRACLDESGKMLEQRFQEKDIALLIDVSKAIEVMVEKTSFISSVINNLLTNAIKFSFNRSTIEITAKEDEEDVLLSFRDHGIGIPEKLLHKIFDMSGKTSRPGTNNEKGTGFGMPLVKRFVDAYGGDITLSSHVESDREQERGTKVELRLKRGM